MDKDNILKQLGIEHSVAGMFHKCIWDCPACAALKVIDYYEPLIEKAREEGIKGLPKIVCLCGSGRFKDDFNKAEYRETLKGNIVLTIGCNTKDIARCEDLKHHKPMLDELHLRKIDLADEVLVLNIGGYIGESTANEIAYAEKKGKTIRYLEALKKQLEEGG